MVNPTIDNGERVAELFEGADDVHEVSHYPDDPEIEVVYDGSHNCDLIREAFDKGWVVDSVSVSSMREGYASVYLIPISHHFGN